MNRIKNAFQPVKADEEMKNDVKEFLLMQEEKKIKSRPNFRRQMALAMCCLLVILGAAGGFEYNQVYAQNAYVEVSGPVQLGVILNKKDKVIKLEGFNECGREVAGSVDVKHMTYEEAINTIMECDAYVKYVDGDSKVFITVDSKDEKCQSTLQKQSDSACHQYQKKHQHRKKQGKDIGDRQDQNCDHSEEQTGHNQYRYGQ